MKSEEVREEPHIKALDDSRDHRPQKGMWAPGYYLNNCHECQKLFLGDKRAMICADCAYDEAKK